MNVKSTEIEYTFDNPSSPYARWGVVIQSPRPDVVRLAYIGTGFPSEIKGSREKQ